MRAGWTSQIEATGTQGARSKEETAPSKSVDCSQAMMICQSVCGVLVAPSPSSNHSACNATASRSLAAWRRSPASPIKLHPGQFFFAGSVERDVVVRIGVDVAVQVAPGQTIPTEAFRARPRTCS